MPMGSGLALLEVSLDGGAFAPYTSSLTVTDGVHTLAARTKDNAGNVTESTQTIKVDTVTPTIALSLTGAQGTGGWYISNVNVSATTSDSGSGINTLQVSQDGSAYSNYQSPITFSDGVHTYRFKTTDNAGNVTETAL